MGTSNSICLQAWHRCLICASCVDDLGRFELWRHRSHIKPNSRWNQIKKHPNAIYGCSYILFEETNSYIYRRFWWALLDQIACKICRCVLSTSIIWAGSNPEDVHLISNQIKELVSFLLIPVKYTNQIMFSAKGRGRSCAEGSSKWKSTELI